MDVLNFILQVFKKYLQASHCVLELLFVSTWRQLFLENGDTKFMYTSSCHSTLKLM